MFFSRAVSVGFLCLLFSTGFTTQARPTDKCEAVSSRTVTVTVSSASNVITTTASPANPTSTKGGNSTGNNGSGNGNNNGGAASGGAPGNNNNVSSTSVIVVPSSTTTSKSGGGKGSSSVAAPPTSTTSKSNGGGSGNGKPSSSSAAPPASTSSSGNGSGDPQTSLTLDKSVIAPGFAVPNGDPSLGQADSLVSTNNFINFCAGKTITNGQQVKNGSCNPVPMGDIPSKDKMPSAKFQFPGNFGTIQANKAFTISMAINNLATGNFTNAAASYFGAPQQLDPNGLIRGHSHVVIELIDSLASTAPLDPSKFSFFKGLNVPDVKGVLTADVTNGLPAGVYRLSSINSASNHQPVLAPIAQHGSLDDIIYFTVTEGSAGRNNSTTTGKNNVGSHSGRLSRRARILDH